MNKDEACPEIFFIFVNRLNPITCHNLKFTKCFHSAAFTNCLMDSDFLQKYQDGTAKYLPFIPNGLDVKIFSPYMLSAINDYRVEYDCEVYRKHHYPLFPSRLSSIFAFGDYESCKKVSEKYKWNLQEVKKFRLIKHELNRVVKANMEHISLARHAYKISTIQSAHELWKSYWDGDSEFSLELPTHDFKRQIISSGLIWEYLIEGKVELYED